MLFTIAKVHSVQLLKVEERQGCVHMLKVVFDPVLSFNMLVYRGKVCFYSSLD